MQTTFSHGSHILLTVDQDSDLIADLVHSIKHLLVAINEFQDGIGDARVGTELLHHGLRFSEIMSRNAREQMMNGLELKTTVNEVQPGRAVDVHGSAELALGERLVLAQIGRGHPPVRECDLNMQRHGDDVGNQDEGDANGPCRQCAPEEHVAKQEPVAGHEDYLGGTNPPGFAASKGRRRLREDMSPREKVEVETSDAHDGIISVLLVRDDNFGSLVPHKGELVVGGTEGLEEGRAGSEERDILDVGVVFLCTFTRQVVFS